MVGKEGAEIFRKNYMYRLLNKETTIPHPLPSRPDSEAIYIYKSVKVYVLQGINPGY
jgi:hypothetical protein